MRLAARLVRGLVINSFVIAVALVVSPQRASAQYYEYFRGYEGLVAGEIFMTHYYDVATSNSPSASGYGGNGSSGGIGDGLVRIVNGDDVAPQQQWNAVRDDLCIRRPRRDAGVLRMPGDARRRADPVGDQ